MEVPLGRRAGQGVVVGVSSSDEMDSLAKDKIKSIRSTLENSFVLDEKELELYEWMSKYYHYSLGKLVFDCLPKFLKRPKKIEFSSGKEMDFAFDLNLNQGRVFSEIRAFLSQGFSQHYIHGVTGSGKSLIYLNLIKEVLKSKKSVQFLLPEINLTPQFVELFKKHLGTKVYSYHSGVTPSEKYTIWKALKDSHEPVLVMGVRSSLFLPAPNLGMIIVDEEHDSSFKQTDRCPYNARDVALKKAHLHGCPAVLGSATPTMESFLAFATPKQRMPLRHYYTLKERAGDGHFPKMTILNSTQSPSEKFQQLMDCYPLLDQSVVKIRERLERGEQVLVFINKLGYSSYIQCRGCGHQFFNEKCGCENNLRYFKQKNLLSCSHCEYKTTVPEMCPECGSLSLLNKGYGTEKVQAVLSAIFPDKRIERFDRDEITSFKQLNDKLDRFHNAEIDILVGTQMLAKGHNFERVNLVVMLGVDSLLNFSDFRSTEKMYQLVKQVAGRAGRYSSESEVVIQTLNPQHSVFEHIHKNTFDEFYREELALREICFCPPYSKVVLVSFSSRFRDRVIETVHRVAKMLNDLIDKEFSQVRLLGPTPLSIEKKANQYSWAIMLKSLELNQLHNLLNSFELNYQITSSVSYKIDVDPQHVY